MARIQNWKLVFFWFFFGFFWFFFWFLFGLSFGQHSKLETSFWVFLVFFGFFWFFLGFIGIFWFFWHLILGLECHPKKNQKNTKKTKKKKNQKKPKKPKKNQKKTSCYTKIGKLAWFFLVFFWFFLVFFWGEHPPPYLHKINLISSIHLLTVPVHCAVCSDRSNFPMLKIFCTRDYHCSNVDDPLIKFSEIWRKVFTKTNLC